MMDVSVVSLDDLTGIVVCVWWITMVMSHKQEEQKSAHKHAGIVLKY